MLRRLRRPPLEPGPARASCIESQGSDRTEERTDGWMDGWKDAERVAEPVEAAAAGFVAGESLWRRPSSRTD